jgi:FMN phosphatase YigB (HAD superfamily)
MEKEVKAVLFDLDGTLLPLDNELLSATYFKELIGFMAECGYDKDIFGKALFGGIEAMFKNDGSSTNEAVFCKAFSNCAPWDYSTVEKDLDRFYKDRFIRVKSVCSYSPLAKAVVELVKARGKKAVLATQPVFPSCATESRMNWAGLSTCDFELYTTFENSRYSKPNPAYYIDIAEKIGVSPEECLMVGNDVSDDMSAAKAGMRVFLLTDNLINKRGDDVSAYKRGSFSELIEYIKSI